MILWDDQWEPRPDASRTRIALVGLVLVALVILAGVVELVLTVR